MTDPGEGQEPIDKAHEVPLDQTPAPIDHLQEGNSDDVPLDQTRSEMRPFLGTQGVPERRVRRRD